jgi:hypothetical protein
MGLGSESNFVGVDSDEQNHIARTLSRTTNSERRRI